MVDKEKSKAKKHNSKSAGDGALKSAGANQIAGGAKMTPQQQQDLKSYALTTSMQNMQMRSFLSAMMPLMFFSMMQEGQNQETEMSGGQGTGHVSEMEDDESDDVSAVESNDEDVEVSDTDLLPREEDYNANPALAAARKLERSSFSRKERIDSSKNDRAAKNKMALAKRAKPENPWGSKDLPKPRREFLYSQSSLLKQFPLPDEDWLKLSTAINKVYIKDDIPAAARLCLYYFGDNKSGCRNQKCRYGHSPYMLNALQYALIQQPKTWIKLLHKHVKRQQELGAPLLDADENTLQRDQVDLCARAEAAFPLLKRPEYEGVEWYQHARPPANRINDTGGGKDETGEPPAKRSKKDNGKAQKVAPSTKPSTGAVASSSVSKDGKAAEATTKANSSMPKDGKAVTSTQDEEQLPLTKAWGLMRTYIQFKELGSRTINMEQQTRLAAETLLMHLSKPSGDLYQTARAHFIRLLDQLDKVVVGGHVKEDDPDLNRVLLLDKLLSCIPVAAPLETEKQVAPKTSDGFTKVTKKKTLVNMKKAEPAKAVDGAPKKVELIHASYSASVGAKSGEEDPERQESAGKKDREKVKGGKKPVELPSHHSVLPKREGSNNAFASLGELEAALPDPKVVLDSETSVRVSPDAVDLDSAEDKSSQKGVPAAFTMDMAIRSKSAEAVVVETGTAESDKLSLSEAASEDGDNSSLSEASSEDEGDSSEPFSLREWVTGKATRFFGGS